MENQESERLKLGRFIPSFIYTLNPSQNHLYLVLAILTASLSSCADIDVRSAETIKQQQIIAQQFKSRTGVERLAKGSIAFFSAESGGGAVICPDSKSVFRPGSCQTRKSGVLVVVTDVPRRPIHFPYAVKIRSKNGDWSGYTNFGYLIPIVPPRTKMIFQAGGLLYVGPNLDASYASLPRSEVEIVKARQTSDRVYVRMLNTNSLIKFGWARRSDLLLPDGTSINTWRVR